MFEFEKCDNGYVLKSYLLKNDDTVTEVEIPSSSNGLPITAIEKFAFSEAKYLRSVKFSEGIDKIGESAFVSCLKLKSVILPTSLKTIGAAAFHSCKNLKSIALPNGIELIDDFAFMFCEDLKSVILPDKLKKLGKGAFQDCTGIGTIVFPKGLEYIGPFAFSGCERLKSAVIPENIKVVKDYLFEYCESLENIEFPEGLEEIGNYAFFGCGLRQIKFPAGLRNICNNAFSECKKLEKAEFQNKSTKLWSGVFNDCPKIAAENAIQGLAHSSDITEPFPNNKNDNKKFEWDTALREDVFALAIKYDSFALFDKGTVLEEIVKRNLSVYLPIIEAAGWNITSGDIDRLLNISLENGFVEITAWLLDYKNRRLKYEIGEW